MPETGVEAYSVKAMGADGQIQLLTLDGSGKVLPGGEAPLIKNEAVARQKHYGNLRPRLFEELQKRSPTDLITVNIWAKVYLDYPSRAALASAK